MTESIKPVTNEVKPVTNEVKPVEHAVVTPSPKDVTTAKLGEVKKEVEKESVKVHKKIEQILKEHDYKETNIGLTHEYWNLLNQYRNLLSEGK